MISNIGITWNVTKTKDNDLLKDITHKNKCRLGDFRRWKPDGQVVTESVNQRNLDPKWGVKKARNNQQLPLEMQVEEERGVTKKSGMKAV